MKKLYVYKSKKKRQTKIIKIEDGKQPSFEKYVNIDNEIMVSGENK